MLIKTKYINDLFGNKADSLLVNSEFISRDKLACPHQGILQLTVTAREWQTGQYFVRIIVSLQPGAALFSQEQPSALQHRGSRVEFMTFNRLYEKATAVEVGTRFVHSDGSIGLKPCHGDKVTFIHQLVRSKDHSNISGRFYYQAFNEDNVMKPCVENFTIPLTS